MPTTPRVSQTPAADSRRTAWWLLALLGIALYLILALYQLDLPGLNYDEALDAAPGAQVVLGLPADSTGTLDLFGRRWPLMTMPYVGVTTTYYLVPVFEIFGISVRSVRGAAVFLGVIALILSWGFLRRYFDERVAAVSVLLMAVSPSYVFWSRMGAWVQFVLVPITIIAIWLLFHWYVGGRGRDLVAACFMLGFGLATHISFAWMWGALVVAWLALSPWLGEGRGLRRWLWPLKRAPVRTWALGALAALLGMATFILYNLRNLDFLSYTLDVVSTEEKSWLTSPQFVPSVLRLGLSSFETFLSGDWFVQSHGKALRNPVGVAAFIAALITLGALGAMRRLTYSARRVAFFAVIIAVIIPASVVLRTHESAHHFVLLWPMPQALIGVALFGLTDWLASRVAPQRRHIWAVLLAFVIILLIVAEGSTTIRYHRALAESGGTGLFSDAIYQLAADLDQPGAPQAYAVDWGFRKNLQIITRNRVHPLERFSYSVNSSPNLLDQFVQWIAEAPDGTYLFHAPKRDSYPGNRDLFEEAAYRNGLIPVLTKTYFQRDGRPVIQTYTLQPISPAFDAPAPENVVDARLGESIALVGYDLPDEAMSPGGSAWVTLHWRAVDQPQGNYKVFAHLLDDAGTMWAHHDSAPIYGNHPTSTWLPGEVVADRFRVPISQDLPRGEYRLFIGMYDEATGERLRFVFNGERLQGDTLGLTDVTVE